MRGKCWLGLIISVCGKSSISTRNQDTDRSTEKEASSQTFSQETMKELSVEEEELTSQRNAAISLFKGLHEKIRFQAEKYEARTEAAEMARIEVEIELEQLLREENGSAMTALAQVQTVTQGWLIGVVLGWATGFVLGCLFSPVLGFMLVLPFISAGMTGGLVYSQIQAKIKASRHQRVQGETQHKKEFLLQLQGRSDSLGKDADQGVDDALPSCSFFRRVAVAACQLVGKSAFDVTVSAIASMLTGVGNER